jgi:indole-3-glycerol phosphate synthase
MTAGGATLPSILARVRERLDVRRLEVPLRELAARVAEQPAARPLGRALSRPGHGPARAPLRVIGELKRRSPSAGSIAEALDPVSAARALRDVGCRALSVLTVPDFFGGSLQTLTQVRAAVDLPLLRKDFILDVYQVLEARAFGADAVLLLAAALDDHRLTALRDRAGELGMEVLAEAHGEAELQRLLRLDLPLIGVNARDLTDFRVDLPAALRWIDAVPADRVVVAESGVRVRADAEQVVASRADAVLVGEGLMRGNAPAERFVELFGERDRT